MFKDETIQAYFNSCDWYGGTIAPDDFDEANLTETEIANKDLIVEYEKKWDIVKNRIMMYREQQAFALCICKVRKPFCCLDIIVKFA